MAKYTAGDIIGFADIDRGLTSLPDSWCYTMNLVEVALIDRNDFKTLWTLQNQDTSKAKLQNMKQHLFFQYLSE
jgi:hypothetical protein